MNSGPRPPVWTDPSTGLLKFDTRASNRVADVPGRDGYRVLADESLTSLPEARRDASFDETERARYRAERESREGAADYVDLEEFQGGYLKDVFAEDPIERPVLTDSCDILVVGAGFGALILWHKLRAAGFEDVRFCEKGGDVGGTWYWNRYPGIACDVEAYSYLPLLDETGYVPSKKFASGFEIFEYCKSIAEQYEFYDHCLFHTTVTTTTWDESEHHWKVTTDRGDEMTARVVVLANGILTTPKLARIEGMDTFEGDWFHTARWDHDVDLVGKRIGIIGTGATAIQLVPELAKIASDLYVFQRTPPTVDIREQRATTDEERERWAQEPGWSRKRRERYASITAGRHALKATDDFLSGEVEHFREQKRHERALTPEELVQKQLDSNFRIMEQIRNRVDSLVSDPKVAEILKPHYPYACKRPTFHDEFLPTFNLPHVHLVDTAPSGVRRIDERGVVHDGVDYPLDVLIYATGFQYQAVGTFNMIVGRDGRSLSSKWEADGTRTFLGIQSRNYPNLFVISGPQAGGASFNYTYVAEGHTDYIVWLLTTMRDRGWSVVDITQEAEEEYTQHCRDVDVETAPLRDCLSYYNADGTARPGDLGYYGGPVEWDRRRREAQATLEAYIFDE